MDNQSDSQLRAAVDAAFETEQLEWLQRLVNQPSHSNARDDVEAAARIIDALALEIGLKRTLFPDPEQRYADHRIYSTPGTGERDRALALVGHCDTVFPRSLGFLYYSRDSADSATAGDAIRGPGVLDMKSGLSVVLFALQALRRTAPKRLAELRLRFVCNTDEEVGSPSSRALFEALAPRTDRAMVFEAGRDQDHIVTCRKGTGTFTLTAHGVEAHAGLDHAAGVNAIHALAMLIPSVEALTDYPCGTTVNVGLVTGGTAKNTVPAKASCIVDVRVTSATEAEKVGGTLRALAADPMSAFPQAPERFRQIRCELDGGMLRPPMEASADSQRLRERYESCARAVGLGVGEAPLQGGGSDANLLTAYGVPTIDGLGPFGKFFHSPKEWSSLDSLRKRTQALACFLAGA